MEKNFITSLHQSTKRKYIERMMDNKVLCMKEAKKYGKNYWDGNRKFGYGGYKYIPGRWAQVAQKLIKNYKLISGSKILDVGCGKGYLLYEMLKIIPDLKVYGFDISSYALKKNFKLKNLKVFKHNAEKKIPYKSKNFDLVISINTLHNLEIFNLETAIREINRVGKKKYIVVESFKNDQQLFNLQCWALTCQSFFSYNEWKWLYKKLKYKGDFEFIYFN
jgi:ubiquinone/menaquinone biosynthesis C-methylase UbiE